MPFIFQTFLERSRGIDLLSILRVGKLRLKELQRLTAAGKEPVIAAKQGHLRTCALMGRQTFPDLKDSHSCQALWTLWVGNSKSRGTGSLCSINLSDPSFKPVPLNSKPGTLVLVPPRPSTSDPTLEVFF